jgi:hypothetical protein
MLEEAYPAYLSPSLVAQTEKVAWLNSDPYVLHNQGWYSSLVVADRRPPLPKRDVGTVLSTCLEPGGVYQSSHVTRQEQVLEAVAVP